MTSSNLVDCMTNPSARLRALEAATRMDAGGRGGGAATGVLAVANRAT